MTEFSYQSSNQFKFGHLNTEKREFQRVKQNIKNGGKYK